MLWNAQKSKGFMVNGIIVINELYGKKSTHTHAVSALLFFFSFLSKKKRKKMSYLIKLKVNVTRRRLYSR